MARVRCSDCGKRYIVRDASRVYRCRSCGGRVAGEAAAEESVNPYAVSELHVERSDSLPGPIDGLTAEERVRALREIGKTFRAASAVRTGLYSMAVLYGLIALFSAVAIGEFSGVRSDVFLVMLAIVVGLPLSLFILLIVAASRVLMNPFPWTVVALTIEAPVLLLNLISLVLLPIVIHGVLTAGLAGALPVVMRIRRVRRRYPGLWEEQLERQRGKKRRRPAREILRSRARRGSR
jgi:hypothetical protein